MQGTFSSFDFYITIFSVVIFFVVEIICVVSKTFLCSFCNAGVLSGLLDANITAVC